MAKISMIDDNTPVVKLDICRLLCILEILRANYVLCWQIIEISSSRL